jgi:hypothetical protein
MAIFGQVWFACLVGFGAGVLLDWVFRVRPLSRQVTELTEWRERQVELDRSRAEVNRPSLEQSPFDQSSFDRNSFDKGSFDRDSFGQPAHDDFREADFALNAATVDRELPADPWLPASVEPIEHADHTEFVEPVDHTQLIQQPIEYTQRIEVEPPGPSEVTTVLPYAVDEDDSAGSGYSYDEYVTDEYQPAEYRAEEYRTEEYRTEDYETVGEVDNATQLLPHRDAVRPARASAFDTPFDVGDSRSGDLTPIESGGFQPFGGAGGSDNQHHDMWVGDHGELVGMVSDEDRWSGGDDHLSGGMGAENADWFHLDEAPDGVQSASGQLPSPSDGLSTRLMNPISRNGSTPAAHSLSIEPPADWSEDDEFDAGPSRSLFEPVIPPDPADGSDDAPHAMAGMDATRPVDTAQGPFGPGSALPLPDGSAPSTRYRVKARTSSMVFHTESSPFYERLEPQVWFEDAQIAANAGFTSWERPRSW